ncbi:MAG TPA: phage tail protein [Pyrinomonadaceae bacterium]|nr:phage tail protein [Pyrinomonadaceae bacterium]
MPTGNRVDPYRGFNFLVELDGLTHGGFQECTGLDTSTDVVEYREGADPNHKRKLTGLNTFSNVTLKRGVTDSDELWKWRQTVIDGRTERKNGSIILMDEAGNEKVRWNFLNAWPTKWTGPTFNATDNAVAVETLELALEELRKA